MIHISDIQVTRVQSDSDIIGYARFIIDETIQLKSVHIKRDEHGRLFLKYPSVSTEHENLLLFYPVKDSIAKEIEKAVLKVYRELLS